MADCFVQQHAGPARTEDHFHLSGGRRDRVQLQDRLPNGFLREALGRFLGLKVVELHATAAAGAAARDVRSVLRDDKYVEAGERLRVGGEGAVRCSDEDAAHFI